ncbi:Nucleoporin AMO1 [Cytospora mali]|uniref:Nucleoporin AMO1 n=1 Tax=Cytospora mali TaxID=578113 RepID=A0A194VQA4_CYTMA|nr:Nucleoporin AMO1 [Valsa mali]
MMRNDCLQVLAAGQLQIWLFEHPGAKSNANNNANANPFSALSGGGNNRGGFGKPASSATGTPFSLHKDTIQKDLAEERPSWLLSAYGPGRDAPEQLWGGYPVEQSFEEMRLHYITGEASGNAQGALSDIQSLWGQAQQKIQTALGNLDGAINFVLQAQNTHPNRHDICQQNSIPSTGEFAVGKRPISLASGQPANAFSSGATSGGAFGKPSALGQNANPFSTGGGSAFGRPSVPAQSSPFGQPSALGSGGSPFGQPSALGGGGGAFGQPSPLGQSPSPFGQPSALGQKSATGFGQPSALGQKPSAFGSPAFGQPAQPAQSGGFGQPSQLGAKPNPFSAGTATTSASPFGAAPSPSPFGANNTSSPFGQNAQQAASSPFGQPASTTSASPFGQSQQPTTPEVSMDTAGPTPASNPFGAAGNTTAAPANPFGQPAQPAASNPFAQGTSANTGFGRTAQPAAAATAAGGAGPYPPNASRQHPPYSSYATKGPNGQLQAFKGKGITYKEIDGQQVPGIRNFDGSWAKIWFPDGPPAYYKDTEPDRPYTDQEKAIYEKFVNTGKFELAGTGSRGGMPEAPPAREFCTWDI